MASGKPKLLKDLLGSRSLAGLAQRAAATDTLARKIRSILPQDLSDHVIAANLRGQIVVVIVDGAAWAARVRFEAPSVCRRLRELHEIDVSSLRVRVRPGV